MGRGDKVTSLDVARRAGVSRSAVSRVFTPGASVAPATAERVRVAAEELGYRPNRLARSLLTGQSRMIGLVVSYLDNQFYPAALEKLCAGLEAEGYHVLVFMAAQTTGRIDDVVDEILDYQVDGLILASVALTSDIAERCTARGVPVVLFNRRQGNTSALSVTSDNYRGGRLAAECLVAAGCRRIGHIAGWEGASTQRDREAGFMEGLRAAGLGLYARDVGDFRPEAAKEAARRMFADGGERPDAIFVANDYMAFMVMDVLRGELGLRVPEDVSIVGFDDTAVAGWPAYDLTSVRQDAGRMVEVTVETLLALIDGKPVAEVPPLPVELIERGTVRRAEG